MLFQLFLALLFVNFDLLFFFPHFVSHFLNQHLVLEFGDLEFNVLDLVDLFFLDYEFDRLVLAFLQILNFILRNFHFFSLFSAVIVEHIALIGEVCNIFLKVLCANDVLEILQQSRRVIVTGFGFH